MSVHPGHVSFVLFTKYLLKIYVPGTNLDPGDKQGWKQLPRRLHSRMGWPASRSISAPGGQPHTPHPRHLGGNWEERAGGRSQQETRIKEKGTRHLPPIPLCQATVWAMTVFLRPQPQALGIPSPTSADPSRLPWHSILTFCPVPP